MIIDRKQPRGGSPMRLDCQKAAQAPAWLPATPRPGQVLTPQAPDLGISCSGRRGGMPGISERASRGDHLGGLASGPHRGEGGIRTQDTKARATPAAASPPPAGAARAGSGRRSESCRDRLGSSPVADGTHLSLPTPYTPPRTPSLERRKPPAPLAASRSPPQDRGALKHRWARPVHTARARARKFTRPGPAAAAAAAAARARARPARRVTASPG